MKEFNRFHRFQANIHRQQQFKDGAESSDCVKYYPDLLEEENKKQQTETEMKKGQRNGKRMVESKYNTAKFRNVKKSQKKLEQSVEFSLISPSSVDHALQA